MKRQYMSNSTAPNNNTTVRFCEVEVWTNGHDLGWINIRMRDVIVPLDVIEIHCFGDALVPIEVS